MPQPTPKQLPNLAIEDAQLLFKNFAGAEKTFNSEGDRNFCVKLPRELGELMRADGWNIKELKAKDDGDPPELIVEVAVEYRKGRPPRCVLITGEGDNQKRTDLGADEVALFDYADIKTVDVVLNPYPWAFNGKSGIKAYLKSIFVHINEDPMELKYRDMQDASAGLHGDD